MPRRKKGMTDNELADWIMGNHTVNENGCWIWNGGKNSTGYGCYGKNGRMHLVHRFSLEKKLNRCLLEDECVRHICPNNPNRACYNPDHLTFGSHNDNMRDMVQSGNSLKGVKNYQSKLAEADVIAIRSQRSRFLLRELAAMYNVDQALISMIVNRKIWKHVSSA